MVGKKMESRVDSVEEQMVSVRRDLQKLSEVKKSLGTILEKMVILDRVDLALQKLEEPKPVEPSVVGSKVSVGPESSSRPSVLAESGSCEIGVKWVDQGKSVPVDQSGGAFEVLSKAVSELGSLGGGYLEVAGKNDALLHRLEMPVFEGSNLEGWVFRAKRFFTINRLSKLQKLEAATISMDGKALAWFQWENGRWPTCSWSILKLNLLDRFRLSEEGSSCEKFLTLQQEH
ncbi:hypothetical protein TIFTF001_029824 [Ficus carica]|uniref:Retrotransposon gag domain-containing protein n=1 Tax=Ficus carica TaxID=3494 RepID=A0AA88DWI6_FICCA|nr:hypothetical protein TIFTF001_029824 [Ficus carica]